MPIRSLLCAFLLATCALPAAAQTRRALLIGINDYEPPPNESPSKGGRAGWNSLSGPVNDVEAVRQMLISRFQFEPQNIHVLLNRQATRAAILASMRKHLIEEPKENDVVFFFYAGHGSQVRNSRTNEDDKMDETLVPADSYTGVWDIRDKELARLFNEALQKNILLTAIFDSCHSGSNTRGYPARRRSRNALPDPRDAAEVEAALPPIKDPPEKLGLLVMSASQDNERAEEGEDEDKRGYGAFSRALVEVLRTGPPNLSAREVFLHVKARLAAEGWSQEPVLAGPDTRRRQPLFGGDASARITAAVKEVDPEGIVTLLGGYALGIGVNTELRLIAGDESAKPVRIRVTQEDGLNFSQAEVIQGSAKQIEPGMLFEVERWAPPAGAILRVYVPRAGMSFAALKQWADGLAALRTSDRLQWVDDPTIISPTHVLSFAAGNWTLFATSGGSKSLGSAPAAKDILAALPASGRENPRLFVHLPLADEVAARLELGGGTRNSAITLTSTPEGAHYILAGRLTAYGIEYGWILPGESEESKAAKVTERVNGRDPLQGLREEAPPAELSMPLRTDWFAVDESSGSQGRAGSNLEQKVLLLGQLRAWLTLDSPPESGGFPWRMAFKRLRDGAIITSGTLVHGEAYSLVLRADPKDLEQPIKQQNLYLIAVDAFGARTVLFPAAKSSVETKYPQPVDGAWPAEFEIVHPGKKSVFEIYCNPPKYPCGVDTYILLASETHIPDPTVLESDAVRTRGPAVKGASPLEQLLTRVGHATRGPRPPTPTNWSIQRLVLRSASRVPANP